MSAFKFENRRRGGRRAERENLGEECPGSLAFEAAKSIAGKRPGLLVLTARSHSLLQQTKDATLTEITDVDIKLVAFDLSKLQTVRAAVAELKALNVKFDVIIDSAGVMAPPYALTEEGTESQFGINHIGPFLFTNLLIPQLNDGATIVNVTGRGYQLGDIQWDDICFKSTLYNKWHAYAQSKAANILVHPGTIFTNLARHLTKEDYYMLVAIPMEYKTAQQGAANMVIAAFDPSIKDRSGAHIDDDNQIKVIPEQFPYAIGVENEERLWNLSEELVKEKFVY
ncbi:hypothetical protein BJX63DRAFT_438565 [Aspergillus granulosus]|uniref:Uncharacterized protein n=1 Tax=Aspergillus granulosus TaxID=176169 RepID=A0ABR4GRK3_9EURO